MSGSMLALRRELCRLGYPSAIMTSTQTLAILRYYKHLGGEEAKYLLGHPEISGLLEERDLTWPPFEAGSAHAQGQEEDQEGQAH